MGRGSFLERGIRRFGRSICYRLVFSLPDGFWKEIQDTAPDISTYEIACLHRVLLKEKGNSPEAGNIIDFGQAFRSWARAQYWAAAVQAADERQKDENSLKSVAGARREKSVSSPRGEARHDDDGDDEGVDSKRPQGRLTPEYLERRGRELGL